MFRSRSFGQKIAASFTAVALLAILISVVAIRTVLLVTASKERVFSVNTARVLNVAAMRVARERRAKHVQSYLIGRDEKFLEQMKEARNELLMRIGVLRDSALSDAEKDHINRVSKANADMQDAWDKVITMRQEGAHIEEVLPHFDRSGALVSELDTQMNVLFDYEATRLEEARALSSEVSGTSIRLLALAALVTSAVAGLLAWLLTRALHSQVGAAVDSVQSSSVEIESAARQQAASSKELASTTVEIATTTRQLLAMSRQISSSAQRAAEAAEEAGASACSGDDTVQRAQEAITGIRRQVEAIVEHMRSLGKRSERIGGILELINDLAEQTTILAINATIESASGGEAGKRFGVVASEVRRLADRVGGSAREIRGLIEEIRGAAGTTLAATEGGSMAVESGAARFGEVLSTFKHITERVTILMEIAREIELSVRQQTTAVEQVSGAIAEVAAAAKESESITDSTLETSSQLAGISQKLSALVRTSRPVERALRER